MKCLNVGLYVSLLLMMDQMAFATCADTNPQGPAAVIGCAASIAGMSAVTFWNTILFSPAVIDGYCKKNPTDLTAAQKTVYDLSCSHQKGDYFSYEQFIAADDQMKQALGVDYQFMRGNSYALNTAELSNFLATAAQETTGNGLIIPKYEKDGLYFRTEYSYLGANTCYVYPENPNWTSAAGKKVGANCGTTLLADYYTNYYPYSTYAVAVDITDDKLVYTKFVMDHGGQYNLNTPITVTYNNGNLPTIYGGTIEPPAGTKWWYMNQTIDKGYWVGNGNLQLTGVAMTQFFGWYHQNLVENKPSFANFNEFVKTYLQDGKLAWLGGLWYWNVRIQGFNQPTLHAVLTGPKAACHDIGLTTYLINGGCNNDTERVLYYKYFKTSVFKQSSAGVPYTYQGTTANSMTCSKNLADYCTSS